MVILVINKDFNNPKSPQYLREFASFYDTWLLNKYIGGGIKNFRYYCHVRPNIDKTSDFTCICTRTIITLKFLLRLG